MTPVQKELLEEFQKFFAGFVPRQFFAIRRHVSLAVVCVF